MIKLQNIYFETLLFIFFILTLTYVGGSCIKVEFQIDNLWWTTVVWDRPGVGHRHM